MKEENLLKFLYILLYMYKYIYINEKFQTITFVIQVLNIMKILNTIYFIQNIKNQNDDVDEEIKINKHER